MLTQNLYRYIFIILLWHLIVSAYVRGEATMNLGRQIWQ